MRFSRREQKDLLVAGVLVSLAFAIVFAGGIEGIINDIVQGNYHFVELIIIAFFSAGSGFLLHELMHKKVAQAYGLFAEFYASYKMLVLALICSLAGFVIAAPGAVYISGHITRERNGKISLAGPVTNLVLAVLFLGLLFFVPETGLGADIGNYGFAINGWLALFNMIPVMPFDGVKIWAWNKAVYITVVVLAAACVIASVI